MKNSYLDGGIAAINVATSIGAIVVTGTTGIVLSVVGITTSPRDILNSILGNRVVLRIGDGYKLVSSDIYIETIRISKKLKE